ncbi:nitroreductase family protein [Pseudodesulfovibrio sediminis]|uniref:Nitroreductase n=1 Tax=Pseudodesulfovibrio sediminis TaxID=2810563 RepID=A0ABN6ET24_9BACT|nr:nitroreductase family protein [Pseudodesulfovibrio sediminis]BCS88266.1 nitroreductase [Pseudodesulfovibrio sediminis]
MPLFTINPDKCNKDGLCAADCPAGCIVFEKGALPVPHEKKQAYCLECGHCVAVCPTDAIELARFPVSAVRQDKALKVSFAQAEQFLTGRRSVRSFKDKPVDREQIASLIKVAEFAPSGHNARPTRWAVAATPEAVATIASATAEWMRGEVEAESPVAAKLHLAGIVRAFDNGQDMICRHAPVLAVAYGPKQGVTPLQDGVIATTYLELAASAAGLGACWCGYVMAAASLESTFDSVLGVPDDCTVYGALMLGHPARRYTAIPPRPEPSVTWL